MARSKRHNKSESATETAAGAAKAATEAAASTALPTALTLSVLLTALLAALVITLRSKHLQHLLGGKYLGKLGSVLLLNLETFLKGGYLLFLTGELLLNPGIGLVISQLLLVITFLRMLTQSAHIGLEHLGLIGGKGLQEGFLGITFQIKILGSTVCHTLNHLSTHLSTLFLGTLFLLSTDTANSHKDNGCNNK